MRILIVGAGGVGGLFGAWLLAAHRDVTFLVRPGRAQQLQDHGLQLLSPAGNLSLPSPPTLTADRLHEPFDLILLSCKAYDLETAINDVAPAVGPETAILPLLNGMAHMDLLDQRFGRAHVLGGTTNVSAARTPEGRIRHLNTLDTLQFGDRDQPGSPRIHRIAEALTVPGYSAELRPNILHDLWQKWVIISTAAGITCLLRSAIGDVVAAGASNLVRQLMAETASIATAEDFPPAPHYLDAILARLTEPGSTFTASMLRDIESGGAIEAHQIIGDLLAHARRRGLSTPLLEVAHAHLRCYEERRKRELT
jgi:2-dehydropantoate 2-reductase